MENETPSFPIQICSASCSYQNYVVLQLTQPMVMHNIVFARALCEVSPEVGLSLRVAQTAGHLVTKFLADFIHASSNFS